MRIEKITRRGKALRVTDANRAKFETQRTVVKEGGIPLSLHVPNKGTAGVLRDARKPRRRRSYARADSLDEFTAAMKSGSKR